MKKTVKILTIILVIILITLISFFGIFKKDLNKMSNIIPDYKFGVEFEGTRNFSFVVDDTVKEETIYYDAEGNIVEDVDESTDVSAYTSEKKETKANEESVLTKENYEKSKKIMQERLEKAKISEYDIRLNEENGSILVSLPQNGQTDEIYNVVGSVGKLEIIDEKTNEVLIDNNQLKNATAVYNTDTTGRATVYLQLEFNKEGKQKLKEISTKYISREVEDTNTTADNTTAEESAEPKTTTEISYVKVNFDDTTLIKTYFGEEMNDGILQIPISQYLTDVDTINSFLSSTRLMANILNAGNLPVVYTLSNDNFINSYITEDMKNIGIAVFEIFTAVLLVYMIIKYRKNGILSAVLHVGFIAVVLLGIRYTNVTITISGIISFVFITILNYIFLMELLKNINKDEDISTAFNKTILRNIFRIIPVIVISIVFTVINSAQVNSIGMIAFWGIIIMLIYNFIFTRSIYKIEE